MGGLHVAECAGKQLQLLQRDALAQVLRRVGKARQLVQWRHGIAGPIHPLDAPGLLRIGHLGGKQARAVEIQKRVEVLHAEGVEAPGVALRNVRVAKHLAHHRAVLGLGQAVVVASARARARELHAQLLQHCGHAVVDVLAAVVGMKAQDLERKLRQHLLDDGQQMVLGDGLHAGHHLPLGDAVNGVDVIQPLDAVPVALMDAVDANETRAALRRRGLAHADRSGLVAACLGHEHTLLAIAAAGAQVVQVRHRDRAQASKARIAKDIALAAQHARRGGPGQRAHGAIDFGQQRHVGARVAPGKGVFGGAVVLHQGLARHPAGNQPCELGAAIAAQALQVGQYRAFVGSPQLAVAQAPQHGFDPVVAALVVVLRGAKLQLLRSRQHLAHLIHRAHLRFVHVDHHPFDDRYALLAGCPSAATSPFP